MHLFCGMGFEGGWHCFTAVASTTLAPCTFRTT